MATAARDPVEIEDAQHRLAVAEGLLTAIRTPRGLASARKLLEDEALTEDEARAELTGLVEGLRRLPLRATSGKKGSFHGMHGRQSATRKRSLTKGEGTAKCSNCGAMKPSAGSMCPKCHGVPTTGHDPPQEIPHLVTGELRAADTSADFPDQAQAGGQRRRRRRRKEKAVGEIKEARVTGVPSVPGSPKSQTGPEAKQNEDWGGANPAATAALTDVPITRPPNLREAEGWAACANCVFYNKGMCNLYGFDRAGSTADVVHRGGFPVDRDDLCDSHDTVTPPGQQEAHTAPRYADRWLRETEVIAEAEAAGDVEVLVRARAREAHLRGKLEEMGFHLPVHFDPTKHPRGRGGEWSKTMDSVTKLKPGEQHNVAPGINVYHDHQHGLSVMSHGSPVSRHGSDAAAAVREAHTLAERRVARRNLPRRERHARYLTASEEDNEMHDISEVKSDAYPGLDRSPKKNWVENAGGLPRYMERVAKHLHYEQGKPISKAIQMAVGIVKRWCEGGGVSAHGVHGANVKADTKAKACAAVAEWNAKRAKTKARKVTESWHDELEMDEALWLLEAADSILRPIPPSINYCAKVLGLVESAYDDWELWEGGISPDLDESVLGSLGRTMTRAGTKLTRYEETKHVRNRRGEWSRSGHKLSDKRTVGFFGDNPSGTHEELLHNYFRGGDRSVMGHEHEIVTGSLRSAGHHDLADAMDTERGTRQSYGLSSPLYKKLQKRVGVERLAESEVEEADYFRPATFPRDHIGRFDPSRHPRGRGGRFRDALARLSRDLGRGRTPHPKGGGYHKMEHRMDGHGHGAGESIYRGGPTPQALTSELKKIEQRFRQKGMKMPASKATTADQARASASHHRAMARITRDPDRKEMRTLIARRSEIHANLLDHANKGTLVPKTGGTEKTGADDAAVSPKTVEQHFASAGGYAIRSGEQFRGLTDPGGQEHLFHPIFYAGATHLGKKKPSAGAAASNELVIDHAVGQVLSNFPNVADWHLSGPHDEGGKHWRLSVVLGDGKEHLIRVTEDGEVSEIKPEQISKKADLKAVVNTPSAPAAGAAYDPSDYEHTGDYNVVSHMSPGTIFKGSDGHHYKLHGDEWIKGKKGPVKAAHIENLNTGTHKNVPYFAIHGKEYEIHQIKGSAPVVKPEKTSSAAAFEDLMKSVEGQHGSLTSVAGKSFVVTGAIPGHTRPAVLALIEKAGGHAHSSVTNSTDVLVTGDKVGAKKIGDAKKKGVMVVPWDEFKHLIESEFGVRPVRLALTLGDLEVAEAAGDVDQIVRLRARARVLEERDYSTEERRKMAARGEALSDGSFPIKDRTDLANAITRLPQAGDKGKALRHIHKRAAALGAKDVTKKHEARLHA